MTKNCSTVALADGREVFMSYGVIVAAFVPGRGYLQTDEHYSQTTTKHIKGYVRKAGRVVPDSELRELVAPITDGRGR
jgi:hypothetical protein